MRNEILRHFFINFDPSARNEPHVGILQVEKMVNVHDMG